MQIKLESTSGRSQDISITDVETGSRIGRVQKIVVDANSESSLVTSKLTIALTPGSLISELVSLTVQVPVGTTFDEMVAELRKQWYTRFQDEQAVATPIESETE